MKKKGNLSYNFWFKNIIRVLIALLCIYYVVKGEMFYLEGGVMFLASSIVVDIFFRLVKIKLSNSTDFIIQLFIAACLILGKMYNVYGILPWWDSFVHFISGILLAIGSLLIVKVQLTDEAMKKLSPIFLATYTLLASIACAALWEIWEFAGDHLFGLNSQGGSLLDTMTDICMGTGGAVIAAVLVYYFFKSGKFKFIGEFMDTFSKINKKRES